MDVCVQEINITRPFNILTRQMLAEKVINIPPSLNSIRGVNQQTSVARLFQSDTEGGDGLLEVQPFLSSTPADNWNQRWKMQMAVSYVCSYRLQQSFLCVVKKKREQRKPFQQPLGRFFFYDSGPISHVPGTKPGTEEETCFIFTFSKGKVSRQHVHAGMSSYICECAPQVTGRSLI